MPLYFLYTRQPGNSAWNYTGYQLNVTGSQNSSGPNGLQVTARTYPKTTPPNPGAWNTITGVTRSGSGNPNSPANGDELGLPSTLLTVSSLTGDGTYDSTGDSTLGAGYYTSQGPEGDEGDWCATAG